MKNLIRVRPALQDEITRQLEGNRLLYVGGATGWGKTMAVKHWLAQHGIEYEYMSALSEEFEPDIDSRAQWIVVDDVHALLADGRESWLCESIKRLRNARFIIMGRGPMPSFFVPFVITGQAGAIDISRFGYTQPEIARMLADEGLEDVSEKARALTTGYPVFIQFILAHMKRGEKYDEAMLERVRLDVFVCFDEMVYPGLDERIRKLLLHMSPFRTFNVDMAAMVTGWRDAAVLLRRTANEGSYLIAHDKDNYELPLLMQRYLVYKRRLVCSDDFIRSSYHNAGLYFELHGDTTNAMDCYQHSGDTDKVCELLVMDSRRNPGNGHYYANERFYMAMPEERIRAVPELMCGMAMMHSLVMRPEESDRWFGELEKYCNAPTTSPADRRRAQGLLAYLRIALPHLGSRRTASYIIGAAKLRYIHMPEFSVTSGLPSILNGGKDFCNWTRHNHQMYRILKKPCEIVLGKYGVGMPEIALAESMLVRGEDDIDSMMALLNRGIDTAATSGTPEMVFAGTAVLMRLMIMRGNMGEARRLMVGLRARVSNCEESPMQGNMDALETLMDMQAGSRTAAEEYLRTAPDERSGFYILYRYRYIIKVRAYIQCGQLEEAVSLLGRLMNYFTMYNRTYGQMEALMLFALCQYRMGRGEWQDTLNRSLLMQEEYGCIRVAGDEGAAIWELITQAQLRTGEEFSRRVSAEAKHMAVLYPKYLKPVAADMEPLTAAEKSVLHLIKQGLTNDEIAHTLNVTVRTVKFHVGNIYSKLGVKGRLQAIERARELKL